MPLLVPLSLLVCVVCWLCTVGALFQWRGEIARFTAPGSLKVLVYHGAKRGQVRDGGWVGCNYQPKLNQPKLS